VSKLPRVLLSIAIIINGILMPLNGSFHQKKDLLQMPKNEKYPNEKILFTRLKWAPLLN
jgi:hypothetical protein